MKIINGREEPQPPLTQPDCPASPQRQLKQYLTKNISEDHESDDFSMMMSHSNSGISLETKPTPDKLPKKKRTKSVRLQSLKILMSHYLTTNGVEWDDETIEDLAFTSGLSPTYIMRWYKNRKERDDEMYKSLKKEAMGHLVFKVFNSKTGRYIHPK